MLCDRSLKCQESVKSNEEGEQERRRRTFCILDLFEPLAKGGTVLQFEPSFICTDCFIPFVHAMEGGTFSCIAFGPGRIGVDTLHAYREKVDY